MLIKDHERILSPDVPHFYYWYMYGVAEITGQVLVRVNRRSELELELELEFTACLNLDLWCDL